MLIEDLILRRESKILLIFKIYNFFPNSTFNTLINDSFSNNSHFSWVIINRVYY